MTNISYSLSPKLREELESIEHARRELMLVPLTNHEEIEQRWKGMINKLYYSLALTGNPLRKSEMIKLLSSPPKKKMEKVELEVFKYKYGIDHIAHTWTNAKKTVRVADIMILYDISCYGKLRYGQTELQRLLDYLDTTGDSPVVKAAIATLEIVRIRPFTDGNGRIARLVGNLFLAKHAHNMRGFVSPEKYWLENMIAFREASRIAQSASSATIWVEFFAQSIRATLTELLGEITNISSISKDNINRSFIYLTDRQKRILTLLDQPNISVSNKLIQDVFSVSQITASRDLTKLSLLGLLYKHGKGRSIRYTKV